MLISPPHTVSLYKFNAQRTLGYPGGKERVCARLIGGNTRFCMHVTARYRPKPFISGLIDDKVNMELL